MFPNQVHGDEEKISGVVERITFHSEQNGWSVLKVSTFRDPSRLTTVVVHQAQVFAGATMDFFGIWTQHPKFGEQFKAMRTVEKKPASAAALERYLGSGLIKGVGPVTAKRIVKHFKERTLEVFESNISELLCVPGIASKKLKLIKASWEEHKAIRDVMLFLQNYGISTLFATKIFKTYGDASIERVSKDPYCLARDIYGIGFFSADKIALSMGFERQGELRIQAGIKHALAASREEGHCYLSETQTFENTTEVLNEPLSLDQIQAGLAKLNEQGELKIRTLQGELCYYSNRLYYDEQKVAELVLYKQRLFKDTDLKRIEKWVCSYCKEQKINLSEEQFQAVTQAPLRGFSILTGGPGCGKTTCTKVLVKLLKAMKLHVTLAAPTGRASQRMTEVMGFEAKTIHRLLGWSPHKNGFDHDEDQPLETDFLIVDEVSMLDISLAASLLKGVSKTAQVLFIGDPDQLPAVGAGNVLSDLLKIISVPRFCLTQVFRQAKESFIITHAHTINKGQTPKVVSPIQNPHAFSQGVDCLFVDANEPTQNQTRFLKQIGQVVEHIQSTDSSWLLKFKEEWVGRLNKREGSQNIELSPAFSEESSEQDLKKPVFEISERFSHVNLKELLQTEDGFKQLLQVVKNVHPWSTLRYGFTAQETLLRFCTQTLPRQIGSQSEIQVLSPQVRGSLGTHALNQSLQSIKNPPSEHKNQIRLGDRLFRQGDRVIQTRNNYDLGVFNGDIGQLTQVDPNTGQVTIAFSGKEMRQVEFTREQLSDLQLAYAITIHKSQGSEFDIVVLPISHQHHNMLYRNLIYTGLTRAKKLALFIGNRTAFSLAIHKTNSKERQTALASLLK